MVDYKEFTSKLPAIEPVNYFSSDYLDPINIRTADPIERDQAIIKIVMSLLDTPYSLAGATRAKEWEFGWLENYQEFNNTHDIKSLIPKYYGKYPFLRLQGDIQIALSKDAEYNSVRMLMHYIYERFLAPSENIIELGCGTGHHLYQLADIDSSKTFYGLDWSLSSQKILGLYQQLHSSQRITAKNIDFFSPPIYSQYIPYDSAIYTFAALEQIGADHDKIIEFMIAARPRVVVHLEPIYELMNQEILLEYLSAKYFLKRNYLSGFLSNLLRKQDQGKIKVHFQEKTGVGSLFIEGYSLIVWSPNL